MRRVTIVGLLMIAGLTLGSGPLAGVAQAQQPELLTGDPTQLTAAENLSVIEARNALARANYLPNLTGFQTAVETGDLVAIPLYQAAGLVLSKNTLRSYIVPIYGHSDTFDPEVASILLKGGVDRQNFCLDPSGKWDQYFVTGRGLQHEAARTAFLRGLCGDDDTVLAISALHRAEDLKLSAQTLENEARPETIAACVDAYAADHPVEDTVTEAKAFSLFNVESIEPPHDTVMMELSSWHLSGQKTDMEEAYDEAVWNGCGAAIPAHVVNTVYRDRLAAVLELLRPGLVAPEIANGG